MAMRRPRVKPSAILKPRRVPKAVASEAIASDQAKIEELITDENDIDPNFRAAIKQSSDAVEEEQADTSNNDSDHVNKTPDISTDAVRQHVGDHDDFDVKPHAFNDVPVCASPSTQFHDRTSIIDSGTFRATIIARRKSITHDGFNPIGSPSYAKSPSYSMVRGTPVKEGRSKMGNDDDTFGMDHEDCFKSPPFMSPSITRRGDPSMSPYNGDPSMSPYDDGRGMDWTKSPSSGKMRRIRPTPCFATRRNSVQGTSSTGGLETEEIEHRRPRLHSTSSNHSGINSGATPQYQRMFSAPGRTPTRVRTESVSSSVSDIRDYTPAKMKRSHRSEEYQRVANAKREFNLKLNGKPPDRSSLTMYDLIYYNPLSNPMTKPAGKGDKTNDSASLSSSKTRKSLTSLKSEPAPRRPPVKSEKPTVEPMPVPQLKLGANGEIVLDEKSLVIETTGDKVAREVLANSEIIYDDEFSGTSGFYKRQKRTRDWLPLETIKFYRSLQAIGTDFSVMLQLFPNRSRRDLKLKFKKEEKHNMALINKALLHPKEFNVEELKFQFAKEDEEIELKKQQWAELRKQAAVEKKQHLQSGQRRNPCSQISRSMRDLTDGDLVYENEFITLPKRRRRNKHQPNDLRESGNGINGSVRSPSPINHSTNHHPDSEKKFTYATHKLPNFTEMITLHKSKNASAMSTVMHDESAPLAISNNLIDNNMNHHHLDETHADDVFRANLTISDQLATTDNFNSIVDIPNGGGPHGIDVYGNSEVLNCTTNGSTDDIMNMDIIFDNTPIEIDTSIEGAGSSHSDSVVNGDILNGDIIENAIITPTHIEQVDLNGQTFQILTLNEPTSSGCNTLTGTVADMLHEPISSICSTSADVTLSNLSATNSIEYPSSYESNICAAAEPVPAVQTTSNGISDTNGNTNIKHTSDSVEQLVATATDEPQESNDVTQNEDDGKSIFDELEKSRNAAAEKEREAKELEERRRKRKPLPVLAIKYKRRHKIANTNETPSQSSAPETGVPTASAIEPPAVVERESKESPETVLDLSAPSNADLPQEPAAIERIAEPSDGPPPNPKPKSPTKPSTKSPAKPTARPSPHSTGKPSIKSPLRRLDLSATDDDTDATHPEQCIDRIDATVVPDQINEQEQANDSDVPLQNESDEEQSDSLNSLVVVESQDPNDPTRTTYAVHIRDPVTKLVSDQPLDLPDEVIQRIRQSIG